MRDSGQARLVFFLFVAVLLSLFVLGANVSMNTTNGSVETNATLDVNLSGEVLNATPAETPMNISESNTSENVSEPPVEPSAPDLADLVEAHKGKLTKETKEFLKNEDNKAKQERFLIKHDAGFDEEKLDKFSKVKKTKNLNIVTFKAKAKDLAELIVDTDVEFLELDQEVEILGDVIPWNVPAVEADEAWNDTTGAGVKVAILDTGIAPHSDLSVVGGWNVVDENDNYEDSYGHGTAVAGVLAALLNDEGLVGVAPGVDLYAVKVMAGSSGSLSDAILGVSWALDHDVDVLSMSFGLSGYSQVFKEALDEAADEGVLLVAAAGNDGGSVRYPAAYTDVIAVGAVDENNNQASFSNYGFELELVAPGVGINTTGLSGYTVSSGTSLAVPHVAGVAALLMAYNSTLDAEEVRAKLREDALDLGDAGKDDDFGYGLVQANLGGGEYNYTPDEYYYEIFNITDYDSENESSTFWLSGFGTIDGVTFLEGYYLVKKTFANKTITERFRVDENGTFHALDVVSGTMLMLDDYAVEGTTSDGILWVNGDLDLVLDDDMEINFDYIDAECYDLDGQGSSLGETYYEYCYFPSHSQQSACEAIESLIDCGGQTDCDSGATIGEYRSGLFDEGDAMKRDQLVSYFSCYDIYTEAEYRTTTKTLLIMDQKRSICVNSTHYAYQGRYAVNNQWTTYDGPQACADICNSSRTVQTSTKTVQLGTPCDTNASGNTTDLIITKIVPIQVVPDVPLIKDRTTVIRIYILNNGSISVQAKAKIKIPTTIANTYYEVGSGQAFTVPANETVYEDLNFTPTKVVTNANISVEVEIYEG